MLERLRNRFTLWREYRETVYQLGTLDDWTLADAGIARSQIKRRARDILYGRVR